MKNIICLLIGLIFISVMAHSQNTCIDAKNLFTNPNDSIPPPGTISPVGPDLGCLTVTGRQMWYFMPVCQTGYIYGISAYKNIIMPGTIYDSMGVILYGPFNTKISDCSNLTSSKIIGCNENAVPNSGTSAGFILNDSLYEGNYYYILVTFSDSIPPTAPAIVFWPGGIYSNCFECNNKVSVIKDNNLCMYPLTLL